MIKCVSCKWWEEFDEGLGYCVNPKTEEDMTDDTAACSLGEKEIEHVNQTNYINRNEHK